MASDAEAVVMGRSRAATCRCSCTACGPHVPQLRAGLVLRCMDAFAVAIQYHNRLRRHRLLCTCVCVLQADVFSFGIMMYEVLQRYIMLSAVAVRGTYDELEAYCARVADGYRPPLHSKWPAALSKLIQVSHQ